MLWKIIRGQFLSKRAVGSTSTMVKTSGAVPVSGLKPSPQTTEIIKVMDPEPLWKLSGSAHYFVRLAGFSGACAVILGAYGSHSVANDQEKDEKFKKVFDIANRYHFIHSLALLGVPLCRYPILSGSLFLLGINLFCGSIYYTAITNDNSPRKVTPIGGMCFILGWLALMI